MESFTLASLFSYQWLGLALLITGIILLSTNKNEDESQKTISIVCICFGVLFLMSSINIWDALPKGAQQDHGDSSDFDMLGGSSK